jgi:hypothetical protein
MDIKALPTFVFALTKSTAFSGMPEHADAREAAKAIDSISLPSFVFC